MDGKHDADLNDIDMAEPVDATAEPKDPVAGKVVVITGASSGIGRATAVEFAKHGSNVVLASRRKSELETVAEECRQRGVQALVQVTDTTDEVAVRQLAAAAVEHFGSIDVWVNDAAVSAYGNFLDIPTEDFRQVLETDVMGYVHGARAALRRFRLQGYGRLINVDSINAVAPVPYSSAYVASKYAIRGLSEALRLELEAEGLLDTVKVCNVMPSSVDTNLFQNAANFSRREVRAIEPVYDPTTVAKAIVKLAGADNPKGELIVGTAGQVMKLEHSLSRSLYEKMISRYTSTNNFSKQPAGTTHGNLYNPIDENTGMRGGWKQRRLTGRTVNLAAGAAIAAAAGLIGIGIYANRRLHHRASQ